MLLLVPPEDAAEVAAGLNAQGTTARLLGPSSSLDANQLKKSGAATLARTFVLAPADTTPPPRRAALEAAWRRRFAKEASGASPSAHVFAAYDTLQVLARAARETKGDPERTAMKLRSIDYDGTTGRVAFDENGERRGPPLLRRVFTDQGVAIPFAAEDFVGPGTSR